MCSYIFFSNLASTKVIFYLVLREHFGKTPENFSTSSQLEVELANDISELMVTLYRKNAKAK